MEKLSEHKLPSQHVNPCIIKVKVVPKAKFEKIKQEKDSDGKATYKIYVTAAPEDGKANKAVIKLLAKMFGTAKSNLTIMHGLTSAKKTILVN
ncbi:MAG: hypothetical protein C0432_04855 [Candidatus Puniceispirillum sp.]|nr:hypothetical protein [Candidatus Pelagibacter sp.]MBA4283603.1 hypothetical protein [Candidatus Puniceispirillum sp.]